MTHRLDSSTQFLFRITLLSTLLTSVAFSQVIAGVVKVQPIQVCNDAGASCANSAKSLLSAETNKIWDQAGIDIVFLPFTSTNETDYLSLDDQAEVDAFLAAGPGSSTTASVISMWFVDNHFDAWGEINTIGGNRIVIDDGIFSGGPKDTIAHELGHAFGLKHDDPGMDSTYLMPATNTSFTVIGDIVPDGAMLEKLTRGQTTTALASSYVIIPEPESLLLLMVGLGIVLPRLRR